MSEVRMTEAERETIWAARKGAPWSFDPNWLQKAERAIEQIIAARLAEVTAERDRLSRWKTEALHVMDGLQDIGRALDLGLGDQGTGPVALRAIEALQSDVHRHTAELVVHLMKRRKAEAENARLRDTLARVEALAAAMDAEANDYSARHPERSYDKGADDQLDADRRLLRAALAGGDR